MAKDYIELMEDSPIKILPTYLDVWVALPSTNPNTAGELTVCNVTKTIQCEQVLSPLELKMTKALLEAAIDNIDAAMVRLNMPH